MKKAKYIRSAGAHLARQRRIESLHAEKEKRQRRMESGFFCCTGLEELAARQLKSCKFYMTFFRGDFFDSFRAGSKVTQNMIDKLWKMVWHERKQIRSMTGGEEVVRYAAAFLSEELEPLANLANLAENIQEG